jgi:putative transposon-encoded protein
MALVKNKTNLKATGGDSEGVGRLRKAKFRVFGEEMIEKMVRSRGTNGRVYLPPDWVGKLVKIIRID